MSSSGDSLSKIEHIVVLMQENRSFDNFLGWLYDPANDPPFDVGYNWKCAVRQHPCCCSF